MRGSGLRLLLPLVLLLPALPAQAETLTLAGAIARVRADHPDVRAWRAEVGRLRGEAGVALSGYLPSVDLLALGRGDVATFRPVVEGTPQGSMGPTNTIQRSALYQGTLGISQLVFDGGRTLGAIAAARAQVADATVQIGNEQLQREAAVTTSYFASLEAQALLGVAREFEARMLTQVQTARHLITAGVRPEFDAVSAQLRYERAVLDRVRAEGTLATRRAELVAALGADEDEGFELADAFTAELPEEALPVEEVVARAFQHHPELRSLQAQLIATEARLRVARSDYFPTMSLNLAGLVTGSTDDPRPIFDLFGTLTIQAQIFSGLSTKSAAESARQNISLTRSRTASRRSQVRLGVVRARAALEAARRADEQAAKVLAQAVRLLESAQKRYAAGLLTFLELVEAQGQEVTAKGLRISARYQLALSRAELRRSHGGSIIADGALR